MRGVAAFRLPLDLRTVGQRLTRRSDGAAPSQRRATNRQKRCSSSTATPLGSDQSDFDQWVREGHTEEEYVQKQANKNHGSTDSAHSLARNLEVWDCAATADVAVVGCGPAGLALAAEVASRGLTVVLIGADVPFVNNYGVWVDEFEAFGLEQCLEHIWPDAVCYFGEGEEVTIDRSYGRVDLDALRLQLVRRCREGGVQFFPGFVETIDTTSCADKTRLGVKGHPSALEAKLVTLASGAAAGKFLEFEPEVPSPGAQTAYGIEVELDGYAERYPGKSMLFMDYRRHHTGLWPSTAGRLKKGQHPDGGDGLWSSHGEVPSFLYAMPLSENRVFLEETCLVAKPPLPFSQLKRRLDRRIEAMGLKVRSVLDEEWSYIPVGGPLPIQDQSITAFGAAANLIHPSSGYSLSRSLREAPTMAAAIQGALATQLSTAEKSHRVWAALWSTEKRAQASFHVFGMELLTQFELKEVNDFFMTFFRLPPYYWKGFLSTSITSFDLLVFAVITFLIAPPSIKMRLIGHLITDPSGSYMLRTYFTKYRAEIEATLQEREKSGR